MQSATYSSPFHWLAAARLPKMATSRIGPNTSTEYQSKGAGGPGEQCRNPTRQGPPRAPPGSPAAHAQKSCSEFDQVLPTGFSIPLRDPDKSRLLSKGPPIGLP